MTQEDKQLLLKDLCARLPYGVKVSVREYNDAEKLTGIDVFRQTFNIEYSINQSIFTRHGESIIKPYLRSLSSMTEEEKEYVKNRWCYEDWNDMVDLFNHYKIEVGDADSFVDWLNEHHFDRGLIEKGLALEAPKNMYKED